MFKQLVFTITSFLLIDLTWIYLVVNKQYNQWLKKGLMLESPKLLPAIVFYLLFCFSLWFLIINNHSGDLKETLFKAFLFGVVTYSTYTLTNYSIIDGWHINIVIQDILWGGVLATLVTYIVLMLK